MWVLADRDQIHRRQLLKATSRTLRDLDESFHSLQPYKARQWDWNKCDRREGPTYPRVVKRLLAAPIRYRVLSRISSVSERSYFNLLPRCSTESANCRDCPKKLKQTSSEARLPRQNLINWVFCGLKTRPQCSGSQVYILCSGTHIWNPMHLSDIRGYSSAVVRQSFLQASSRIESLHGTFVIWTRCSSDYSNYRTYFNLCTYVGVWLQNGCGNTRSKSLRVLEVAFNNCCLRCSWSLSANTHTSILHYCANMLSIYNLVFSRSAKFIGRASNSSNLLVRAVFRDSSVLVYSFAGLNSVFGSQYLKLYHDDDKYCAAVVRPFLKRNIDIIHGTSDTELMLRTILTS